MYPTVVLRRTVLWVLSEIARERHGGAAVARRAALRVVDPLLRPLVAARVRREVAEATLATTEALDDAHAHRLAYLAVAGRFASSPDDVDAVRAAFDEARPAETPPRGARRGGMLAAAGLLVAVIVASLLPVVLDRLHAPPELPPSRGAYRRGGRPEPGSAAARAVFAEDIAAFTVALDRLRVARGTPGEAAARQVLRAQTALVARQADRALGPFVTSYLRAVLDQSAAIVGTDDLVDSAIDTHVRSVDALDASLQARGLGFYVDATVATELATGRHRVYLSSFTVEHVALYRSGAETVRALHLRRLDSLNFEHAMLGFTRDEIRDALVLLDRVEEHMVRDLLPAVGAGASMRLLSAREPIDAWRDEVERAAAEDIRADALRARADPAQLESVGRLYARRRDLFDGWSRLLAPRGIQLRPPDRYGLDLEPYAGVDSLVPADEWRQAEELGETLGAPALQTTITALAGPLVASIERHEVQHRLDTLGGHLAHCPEELAALVECGTPLGHRALAELSAYVAELARDAGIVKTNLALLARYLLDPELVGIAESYAALVAFEGLAQELRIAHGPLLGGVGLDRPVAARLYLALHGTPPATLQAAAARLWQRLLGRRLPGLRLRNRTS